MPSATEAAETIGAGVIWLQIRPLSLPSLPTYRTGSKFPLVSVAAIAPSSAETSTPGAVVVLNHSEMASLVEL